MYAVPVGSLTRHSCTGGGWWSWSRMVRVRRGAREKEWGDLRSLELRSLARDADGWSDRVLQLEAGEGEDVGHRRHSTRPPLLNDEQHPHPVEKLGGRAALGIGNTSELEYHHLLRWGTLTPVIQINAAGG